MSLQRIPHDFTKFRNNPVDMLDISNRTRIGSDYPITESTKLLITGTGKNNSTNIVDATEKTITRYGDTKISTAQSVIGGSSIYFDGTVDYLSIGDTSTFSFLHKANEKYTIDWYVKTNNFTEYHNIYSTDGNSTEIGTYLYIHTNRNIVIQTTYGTLGNSIINGILAVYPSDTVNFHHIAITVDMTLSSDNVKCYIDGIYAGALSKTAYTPSTSNSTYPLVIGKLNGYTDYDANIYLSHFRITNSVLWTSNFTPPKYPSHNYIGA